MRDDEQAVAVDALRDLLFAGAAFRAAVADHFGTGLNESEAIAQLNSRGDTTAAALARALSLTPDSARDMLDHLEAAGFVRRAAAPDDDRKVIVTLTDRARRMADEVRGWLALCLDLVADRPRAVQTFAVVGHGLRSIRQELRDGGPESLRADVGVGVGAGHGDAEALQAALGRAALVLRLTHTLASERDEAAIAAAVSGQLRAHFGARFVGIALVDAGGSTIRYVSLDPLPEDTRRRFAAFPLDDTYPVGAAAAHGRAYFHPSVEAAEAEFPGIGRHLGAAGLASMVHLPLVAGADVIGTLAVAWDRDRVVDIDDQGLLTVVAGYAAQSLRRL